KACSASSSFLRMRHHPCHSSDQAISFFPPSSIYRSVIPVFSRRVVEKGADGSKISPDTLYSYRNHQYPPALFSQENIPNSLEFSQGFCPKRSTVPFVLPFLLGNLTNH